MPTSLRRCLMVWVATSPTCATNLSFRLFAWAHPLQGHRLVATYVRSRWKARCMAIAACRVSATVASPSDPFVSRARKAASPSISISSKPGAASITFSSSLAVFTSAWARLMRCVRM